jgi:hypothetical protein
VCIHIVFCLGLAVLWILAGTCVRRKGAAHSAIPPFGCTSTHSNRCLQSGLPLPCSTTDHCKRPADSELVGGFAVRHVHFHYLLHCGREGSTSLWGGGGNHN